MIFAVCNWTVRFFGLVSLLSCICVAAETVAEWKANNVILRLQAWFQLPLGIVALLHFLPHLPGEKLCALQGYLYQMAAVGVLGFDLGLSMLYLLMLEFKWQRERLRYFTKLLHAFIWPTAIVPATYLLHKRSYSRIGDGCWIEENPESHAGLIIRESMHMMALIHLLLSWCIVWRICKFACTIADDRRSKLLARKGLLYASGVTVIQTPTFLWTMIRLASGVKNEAATETIAIPLSFAGLLNMLVFLLYRRDMKTPYGRMVRRIVDLAACQRPKEADSETIQAVEAGHRLFATTVAVEKAAFDAQSEPQAISESSA